ncbi:hypothetical protein Q73A0000_03635 [Kaistella flava (ex Peng et al. 2021)]|uniref:T9SS C-terminal target domain-containing protein n=1 Tax=Kaistella flava (ex Peng et al. 2021) TaxID=2038776 RepID=A0A7M2Y6S1_9FLAO|nr:hypothetical protein [Kaistella flava (ex Peng et al. 2021)]QOW09519.1 hypothetical protein Q73A0000_03635 [Kaistella flava (ex Peng et al. 2021)]
MKKFFLLFLILSSLSFSAQQDYDWFKINKYRTAILSDSLNENSGLDFFNKRLFTINDSGNSSEIFEIDKTTGKIQNVFKTNLINKDWEAITSDSTNIYIGDFGNNVGARKDLVIYKIPFDSSVRAPSSNNAQAIPFYYPEQKDFTPKNLNNDFDAEAMIFLNGKIHVFTKEWVSKYTTHYIVDPAISENQPAQKIETFPTGYVVTDAAYFDKKLYLVGYTKKTEVFLTIFNETEPGIFFKEKPKKYYLGSSLTIGQIEGIAVDEQGIYISGEEFNLPIIKVKPYLYFIPFEKLK